MNNDQKLITALLVVSFLFICFLGYKVYILKNKNVELLANISSLQSENSQIKEVKKDNCDDVLFREQISEVKGYKFFTQCNFASGQYGDYDSKNIFGIENVKTGQKYIIGSKNGIFDQNIILEVIDNRYIFLANSYEGKSRYIMIDTSISWPTNDALTNTVYPRTIDQYVQAHIKYADIVSKF
ncbi:MAG: hypothetical protein EXS50_03165 [Candidatus Taylorbacteria bacterium]|nr:hypothetical protein [Candidatus Taylorbacteria bacterium]